MLLYLRLVLSTVRKAGSPRRDLLWENLALRQQLAVYRRPDPPPATPPARPSVLDAPRAGLVRVARRLGLRPAGDGDSTGVRARTYELEVGEEETSEAVALFVERTPPVRHEYSIVCFLSGRSRPDRVSSG